MQFTIIFIKTEEKEKNKKMIQSLLHFINHTDVFRSLLTFDLSGVIPSGNTILNASLNLFVYRKDLP